MSEPYIGQIQAFGFNFAPRGWAICSGQLLSIAQNTALFSLLGTQYGGDGVTTFALPDLRGRVSLHQGQGPGLSNYTMGEQSGTENVTLLSTQMPAHNHPASVNAYSEDGDAVLPTGNIPASGGTSQIYTNSAPNTQMSGTMVGIGLAGGNQPHPNMQPFLVINWCIALQGIFPSRN